MSSCWEWAGTKLVRAEQLYPIDLLRSWTEVQQIWDVSALFYLHAFNISFVIIKYASVKNHLLNLIVGTQNIRVKKKSSTGLKKNKPKKRPAPNQKKTSWNPKGILANTIFVPNSDTIHRSNRK